MAVQAPPNDAQVVPASTAQRVWPDRHASFPSAQLGRKVAEPEQQSNSAWFPQADSGRQHTEEGEAQSAPEPR